MSSPLERRTAQVGLIIKTEPEMTGIYRWTHDLQTALGANYPLQTLEVSSPDSSLHQKLVYPIGRALGKDLRTAYKNYPVCFENPEKLRPKLWHLASQTFGRILKKLDAPSVITVFDLYPHIFEMHPTYRDRLEYQKAFREIARAGGEILTLTHAIKSEITSIFNIAKERVSVIYPGIGPEFAPKKVERDPNKIVYVGSELPRKNLARLFEALQIVFQENPEAYFVKVGRPQWRHSREALVDLARRLGISERIYFLDYVDDLPQLYSSAGVSVLVSTYEGFGYPALEAMACGTPTVVSNIPTLRETSNHGAVLVDCMDPADIAQGILQVLGDPVFSNELIEKGLDVCEQFSFERWRDEMTAYYARLAG